MAGIHGEVNQERGIVVRRWTLMGTDKVGALREPENPEFGPQMDAERRRWREELDESENPEFGPQMDTQGRR